MIQCPSCYEYCEEKIFLNNIGFDINKYKLVQCSNCSFVFVSPTPSEREISDFYRNNYSGQVKANIHTNNDIIGLNKAVIEDNKKKINYIKKYSQREINDILDIGCGYGFFIWTAKQLNYNAIGLDVDLDAIEIGKKHLGVNIINKSIEEISENNIKFDLITVWSVMEHVRNPNCTFRKIHDLLDENGIIAGNMPNIKGLGFSVFREKWHLLCPPEHLNYYSKNSLQDVLNRTGFEIIFIGAVPLFAAPYFSFGLRKNILHICNNKNNWFFSHIGKSLNRLITLIKRWLIYWPLNAIICFFKLEPDNLFFIAKRND